MKANGLHHVSSITKEILDNHEFYTKTLGLRLVKKSVNQDDTSMYHLFYADYKATVGTDITFFEIINSAKFRKGTNGITRTLFRVKSVEALEFHKERFQKLGVYVEGIVERFGKMTMNFEDHENHRMALMVDDIPSHIEPNVTDEIPLEYALHGIAAVEVTVQHKKPFIELMELLGGKNSFEDDDHAVVVFGNEYIYVVEERHSTTEKGGYGSVHHFALNVDTEEDLHEIMRMLDEEKWRHSGLKDRHWFKACYIQASGNIIVEISTSGPGFTIDEPLETLGERLSLPDRLEENREVIEMYLKPVN